MFKNTVLKIAALRKCTWPTNALSNLFVAGTFFNHLPSILQVCVCVCARACVRLCVCNFISLSYPLVIPFSTKCACIYIIIYIYKHIFNSPDDDDWSKLIENYRNI